MKHIFLFLAFVGLLVLKTNAQTRHESTGWFLFMNNTKLTEKWGFYADLQLRSGDKWANVRNFMFRPGITYYANSKNEITLGYLLNNTYLHVEGVSDNVLNEHRIWEQYVYKHKLNTVAFSHRFRLEQRFIDRLGREDLFAQRFRYFVRGIIPIAKDAKSFNEGLFVALQNEVFLNLQNKSQLNGDVFDQNRAYVALGYRLSKKLDIEAGYLNQAIKGAAANTVNNVLQVAVYTRF
ncbi:DUF2490 domain-containing protein [Pedobacter sp. MC2016-14]|uniref:DUF2490 domain-containing protein n=1 Tax=Pedobacter sp. MC2016-14 TaxID=2897327 RepID=UPI001E411352|nr:DUF2490 domain-containing protein [Pedobacter sp. MC2016-14]MCD0488207.1 DUF2490 domain-containing protein [Pedobacter sp. MC2016-14]